MDIIITLILVFVIGFAMFYIIREKKKGNGCIGCPYASSCTGKKTCPSKKVKEHK